ncbi:hypothetical protein [Chitinophaga sp. YIM B06452]|uniref:hypothetical protein n=1 Tax=Chitinophaga sp. YIM B06452 TaxID=3082158 RepID=UPI0031FEF996
MVADPKVPARCATAKYKVPQVAKAVPEPDNSALQVAAPARPAFAQVPGENGDGCFRPGNVRLAIHSARYTASG